MQRSQSSECVLERKGPIDEQALLGKRDRQDALRSVPYDKSYMKDKSRQLLTRLNGKLSLAMGITRMLSPDLDGGRLPGDTNHYGNGVFAIPHAQALRCR